MRGAGLVSVLVEPYLVFVVQVVSAHGVRSFLFPLRRCHIRTPQESNRWCPHRSRHNLLARRPIPSPHQMEVDANRHG